MGNLFGKFTLYDIISMTIPGFLVMLGVCLVIPGTVHQFMVSVDNSWFIFVIGISVSYSVGWIICKRKMKKPYYQSTTLIIIRAVIN